MIKADLVNGVYEKLGLSRAEAARIVDNIFNVMKDCLVKGENVQIVGFGTFSLRNKNERVGFNPKTGEKVKISARKVLTFKNSRILLNSVNTDSTETPK